MKRESFIVLFFIVISQVATAQNNGYYEVSYNIDGVWSEWKEEYDKILIKEKNISTPYLSVSNISNHPSQFYWRITLTNGPITTDNDGWTTYEGTFEYYITDEYPDIRSIMLNDSYKRWINPAHHNTNKGQTPCVKRTAKAKIKIHNHYYTEDVVVGYNFWGNPKTQPQNFLNRTWNVWFDGVGFGVFIKNIRN